MPIKWRNRKGLKPDILLKRVESLIVRDGDRISFNGFDVFEVKVALETMIDFGENVSTSQREALVSRAVHRCAKTGLSADRFMSEINAGYTESQAKPDVEYFLLTTISLMPPFLFPDFKFGNCRIRLREKGFPKKFAGPRAELFRKHDLREEEAKGIYSVVVSTQAKSPSDAADRCLEALNVFRAFLCLEVNARLTIDFGGRHGKKPINRVVLGECHTVHSASGEIAMNGYCYESNYVGMKPYKIAAKDHDIVCRNVRWLLRKTASMSYSRLLRRNLNRFVGAFDHPDHHSALIAGWACLESLATDQREANNDAISRRCSFLYGDSEFHRQILEHIREYRNNTVHDGALANRPSTVCHQLQRYFRRLVYFYLRTSDLFESREEANAFLDLHHEPEALGRKARLLRLAKKIRSQAR